MGSCMSTAPPSDHNNKNLTETNPQTATLTRGSHSIPIEYSLSKAEQTEEKEIVSLTQYSTPEPPKRNSYSSNQSFIPSITPFPVQKPLTESAYSIILKMTQHDAKELDFIRGELKDIRQGLQSKISILSQNEISTDDNDTNTEENDRFQISQLISTCKDILDYAQSQQVEMKQIAQQKLEAEHKSLNLIEQCNHWKQCVTVSKQNTRKIKTQRDELSMKLDYYSNQLGVSHTQIIESEAMNLSNQQRIRDSETKMNLYKDIIDTLQSTDVHNVNILEIEKKLKRTYEGIHGQSEDQQFKNEKLKKAATTLYDLISKNEEMKIEYESQLKSANDAIALSVQNRLKVEQEMENKLKCIQTKQKEKNFALQTLVKKNNAYLIETQCKINALMEEKEKLSAHCVHWQNLCQQQSQMLEGFQQRKTTKTFHARERYLKSLTPLSPTEF